MSSPQINPGDVMRLKRPHTHYHPSTLFLCAGHDGAHLRVHSHYGEKKVGPTLLWLASDDWFEVLSDMEARTALIQIHEREWNNTQLEPTVPEPAAPEPPPHPTYSLWVRSWCNVPRTFYHTTEALAADLIQVLAKGAHYIEITHE